MRRVIAIALLLSACTKEEESDTDIVETEDTFEGCDAVEIDVNGPAEPVVGDTWVVSLYCDEALVTGGFVIRFEPSDFAQVNNRDVTFTQAGTATLKAQAGSARAEMQVTVAAE